MTGRMPARPSTSPALGSLRRALVDLCDGVLSWPQWLTLGNHDIVERYRRSVLGPLWITLSMGIMIGALGILYARILHQDLNVYLPYLSSGFITWVFISTCLQEGCVALVVNEGVIKQIPAPKSIYLYRLLWRNLVVLGHNLAVFVVVAVFCAVRPRWAMLSAAPGLALLTVNLAWAVLLLAMLCARFRDVPQIVTSVVQLSLLFTPIMWRADPGSPLLAVMRFNPFYQAVELIRAPLLGGTPTAAAWAAATLSAAAGWAITLLLFARYRSRLVYWL